jgi:RND family efflux transporter MFP subunit
MANWSSCLMTSGPHPSDLRSPAPKRKGLKAVGLPILIVGITAVVVFLLMATRPQLKPVKTAERSWVVDTIPARYSIVRPSLHLFGELVAGRRSELRPLVSGLIIEIGPSFKEGGMVQEGELLLQIDPFIFQTDLAEQKTLLKESRAKLAKLRRDYGRAEELFQEKNVSEQFLDDANLAVIEQESIVDQRSIGVQRAEKDLSDARLVAPFTGVLKDVNADMGKQFSGFGDDKVAELIDTSRIDVRFSLSNAQYGRLLDTDDPLPGRPVKVSWNIGSQTLEYDAVIARVGAEIASTTGGIDVYAVIETGGEQTQLRPGAFVQVSLSDKQYQNVLSVPDSALYGEDRIYVVDDGRLAERRVEIHGYSGTTLLLSSVDTPAIREGDLIVITQLREGGPGAKVSVR